MAPSLSTTNKTVNNGQNLYQIRIYSFATPFLSLLNVKFVLSLFLSLSFSAKPWTNCFTHFVFLSIPTDYEEEYSAAVFGLPEPGVGGTITRYRRGPRFTR